MARERDLVRAIIKAVRAKYARAYVRKLADRFTRGLPDLVIVFPVDFPRYVRSGRLLCVETKAPEGRQSPVQRAEQQAIERAGGTYLLAYNVVTVLNTLERMGAVP